MAPPEALGYGCFQEAGRLLLHVSQSWSFMFWAFVAQNYYLHPWAPDIRSKGRRWKISELLGKGQISVRLKLLSFTKTEHMICSKPRLWSIILGFVRHQYFFKIKVSFVGLFHRTTVPPPPVAPGFKTLLGFGTKNISRGQPWLCTGANSPYHPLFLCTRDKRKELLYDQVRLFCFCPPGFCDLHEPRWVSRRGPLNHQIPGPLRWRCQGFYPGPFACQTCALPPSYCFSPY